LESVRKYWRSFTARRHNFADKIPDGYKYKKRMLEAIDSVSVLIKCQQSASGGVMAGHHYNLAYVRDMSGVMRGLLALGYIDEAKSILRFWLYKWRMFGNLLNAEGMGNDSSRLKFMNDDVEIPAYIVLDCFKYYDYTHDDEFMTELFPMMQWAFEVQLPHLAHGMTEFSCDETYIAGGVFPKYLTYNGSAESTLLFITGGEKLIKLAEKNSLWNKEKLDQYREKVMTARQLYKQNFYIDGVLYANNPEREEYAGKPRFRYGFCDGHEINRETLQICWTENRGNGYYLCPQCINDTMPEFKNPQKRYVLNSINFVPLYISSDIFTEN
jgi:hypothetical protein